MSTTTWEGIMAKPGFFDGTSHERVDARVAAVEWRWGQTGHRAAQMEDAAIVMSRFPGVQFTAWTLRTVCTIHLVDGPSSEEGTSRSELNRVCGVLGDTFTVAAKIKVAGRRFQTVRVDLAPSSWDFLIGEAELKARELLAPLDTHQCGAHLCCCRSTGFEHGECSNTNGMARGVIERQFVV
jgi:hypothetical protein